MFCFSSEINSDPECFFFLLWGLTLLLVQTLVPYPQFDSFKISINSIKSDFLKPHSSTPFSIIICSLLTEAGPHAVHWTLCAVDWPWTSEPPAVPPECWLQTCAICCLLGTGDQTHTASWTLDKRFTELYPKPIICCFKGFLFIFMVMCYIMMFPSRLHTSQWSPKIKLPTSSINNVCTTMKLPRSVLLRRIPTVRPRDCTDPSSSVHCRSQWCWDIYLYGITVWKNKCKEH